MGTSKVESYFLKHHPICTNPISKSDFNSKFWIVKPKDYAPSEKEKILPKISPDGKELDYSTTH